MYRSKARLTADEIDEIKQLHKSATAPMIALHTIPAGAKSGWARLHERIDEMAAAHGLKSQAGEWGVDTESAEFLSTFPIVEPDVSDE